MQRAQELLESSSRLGSTSIAFGSSVNASADGEWVIKATSLNGSVNSRNLVCREAAVAMAKLSHPCMPQYVGSFCDPSTELAYVVMKRVHGLTLSRMVQEAGPCGLGETMARQVAAQVASVMQFLHDHGVVYVDLKPENIMVDDEGKVVLLDYNLVHPLPHGSHSGGGAVADASGGVGGGAGDDYGKQPPGSGVQGSHSVTSRRPTITLPAPLEGHSFWGTLEYVAPEVIEKGVEGYSAASDWWSLGVLVFEMLFGMTPFKGQTQERTMYNITMRSPAFPDSGPQVSDSARAFIRALLRHNRRARLGARGGLREVAGHPWLAGTSPQALLTSPHV